MVGGISGISSTPGIITNISAASLGRIKSVGRLNKGETDVFPFENSAENSPELLGSGERADRFIFGSGDEKTTATAYGLPSNELRRQAQLRKLNGRNDENSENATPESSATTSNSPADAKTAKSNNDQTADGKKPTAPETNKANGEPLSDEEKEQVQKLKARDTEVRVHEMAHLAAAGQYAKGGANYSYQTGPDGQQYAIGGSVSIDTSPESTPEATIAKMRQVQAAAMAPAQPSGQDRSVAASASKMLMEAQAQASQKSSAENNGETPKGDTATAKSVATPTAKNETAISTRSSSTPNTGNDEATATISPISVSASENTPENNSSAGGMLEPLTPSEMTNFVNGNGMNINVINQANATAANRRQTPSASGGLAQLSYQQSRALSAYRWAS